MDVFPIDSRVRTRGDFAIPLIATHLHPRSGLCENLAHPATSGPHGEMSDAKQLDGTGRRPLAHRQRYSHKLCQKKHQKYAVI